MEGDHVYRVGESGVLVHNQSVPAKDLCDTPDWQSLHSTAESNRKELARSPALSPGKREFGVAPGRTTIAAADLIVNGKKVKVLKAFSGTANCDGYEDFIPNDQRELKCRKVQGNLRDTDAEAKILESILKMTKESDKGCVLIYVDGPKDVCGSCRDVIADFESKRPCIPVIIKWRGGASTADDWSLPGN